MRVTLLLASSFLAATTAQANPPPINVASGNTTGAINSSNDVTGGINSGNSTGSINSSNDLTGGINSGNTSGAINSSNDLTGGINSGNTATVGPIGSGNTITGPSLDVAPGAFTNTNTNSATGGAGGQGGAASADNANNADNSSSVIVEGDKAARRPYRNVATAYAPTVVGAGGSDSCLGSASGGVSTGLFGISLGGTKKDEACRTIKLSRRAEELGMPDVACQILGQDPKFAEGLRRAGRDCAMSNFQGRMLPVGTMQTMPVGDAVIPQPVRIDETPIQPIGGPERG